MALSLRRATLTDAKLLFDWRNDPLTRKNSRNMDEVPWESHANWLAATLDRDDRILLIGESDGVPIGTVRFDKHPDHYEVSWTGAPSARGKGLSKQMAVQACAEIDGAIIAEIKTDNAPTINMIQACGFTLTGEHDGLGVWRREPLTGTDT